VFELLVIPCDNYTLNINVFCDTDVDTVTVTSPDDLTKVAAGTYSVGLCNLPADVTIDIDGVSVDIIVTTDNQTESLFCNGTYNLLFA